MASNKLRTQLLKKIDKIKNQNAFLIKSIKTYQKVSLI